LTKNLLGHIMLF